MPNKNGVYKKLIIDEMLKDKIIYRLDLVDEGYIVEDYFYTQIAILFIELSEDYSLIDKINQMIQVEVKGLYE